VWSTLGVRLSKKYCRPKPPEMVMFHSFCGPNTQYYWTPLFWLPIVA
jgi:hypothetical protein